MYVYMSPAKIRTPGENRTHHSDLQAKTVEIGIKINNPVAFTFLRQPKKGQSKTEETPVYSLMLYTQ